MQKAVIDLDSQPSSHIAIFDDNALPLQTFLPSQSQPSALVKTQTNENPEASQVSQTQRTQKTEATEKAAGVVDIEDQDIVIESVKPSPIAAAKIAALMDNATTNPDGTKKCQNCFATFKPGASHNCFQLIFSLISKKVDKEAFKQLQSKINQKFVQLAVGKKITLINDQEIQETQLADRDPNKVGSQFISNKKKWVAPRVDMKKQLAELTDKLTGCVSQNQFSENISKISDVFEKYSIKIQEIDGFIGRLRSLSQPTTGPGSQPFSGPGQNAPLTASMRDKMESLVAEAKQLGHQLQSAPISDSTRLPNSSSQRSKRATADAGADQEMQDGSSLDKYEFDMQTKDLSEALSQHQMMPQSNPGPITGTLDVFDLCGYSTSQKFEYPPRSELLSTPASFYSNRRLTKVEWSLNQYRYIVCMRVTFSDGARDYVSPIFVPGAKNTTTPRIQSCVTLPFEESLKTVAVTADSTQVSTVAFRSEYLEYPAFNLTVDENKLTTEFELKQGQQIVGVYGCADTRNGKLLPGSMTQNGLQDYNQDQDFTFLAGLGFIVWTPCD